MFRRYTAGDEHVELRKRVKQSVDRFSGPKLRAADEMLRQLAEDDTATTELLEISRFLNRFRREGNKM